MKSGLQSTDNHNPIITTRAQKPFYSNFNPAAAQSKRVPVAMAIPASSALSKKHSKFWRLGGLLRRCTVACQGAMGCSALLPSNKLMHWDGMGCPPPEAHTNARMAARRLAASRECAAHGPQHGVQARLTRGAMQTTISERSMDLSHVAPVCGGTWQSRGWDRYQGSSQRIVPGQQPRKDSHTQERRRSTRAQAQPQRSPESA